MKDLSTLSVTDFSIALIEAHEAGIQTPLALVQFLNTRLGLGIAERELEQGWEEAKEKLQSPDNAGSQEAEWDRE